jgi:hypothetical protein
MSKLLTSKKVSKRINAQYVYYRYVVSLLMVRERALRLLD